jgi:hypothetical protein
MLDAARPRFRSSGWSLLLLLAVAAASCRPSEPVAAAASGSLPREDFIEIYVALRRAAADSPPPATFEARKQEILARHDATPEDLLRFVELNVRNVGFMTRVWEDIEARLVAAAEDTLPG